MVNFESLVRLIKVDLSQSNFYGRTRVCGYSKSTIKKILDSPNRHSMQIIKISNYMYLKSGYYKRLINYFVNMSKCCWMAALTPKGSGFATDKLSKAKKEYMKFIGNISELKLESEIQNIFLRAYLNDTCYCYICESKIKSFIYYFDPSICEITSSTNGVYTFSVSLSKISDIDFNSFPSEIADILLEGRMTGKQKVQMPVGKAFVIKYHEHIIYPYPPLFELISSIIDVEDYKLLAKAKTEIEAYRFVTFDIPLDDNNKIALSDDEIMPWIRVARELFPDVIGVVPSPMKVNAVQFKSDESERNKVSEARDELFAEGGVSQALLAGATSGSELKISIDADSTEIFRIYRQIEKAINLYVKLSGFTYSTFSIDFQLLDITSFNQKDYIDTQLKLAQASIPNKMELCSANGTNPAKVVGMQFLENELFQEEFSKWTSLKTSYTQTNDDSGRPEVSDEELSPSGEQTRENDSNNKNNRLVKNK